MQEMLLVQLDSVSLELFCEVKIHMQGMPLFYIQTHGRKDAGDQFSFQPQVMVIVCGLSVGVLSNPFAKGHLYSIADSKKKGMVVAKDSV